MEKLTLEELRKKCEDLGIKFPDKATKAHLALMIKGHESTAIIIGLEEEKSRLAAQLENIAPTLKEVEKQLLSLKEAMLKNITQMPDGQPAAKPVEETVEEAAPEAVIRKEGEAEKATKAPDPEEDREPPRGNDNPQPPAPKATNGAMAPYQAPDGTTWTFKPKMKQVILDGKPLTVEAALRDEQAMLALIGNNFRGLQRIN